MICPNCQHEVEVNVTIITHTWLSVNFVCEHCKETWQGELYIKEKGNKQPSLY